MALPLPLPDCRENRAFAWILARAGEYANPMPPNVKWTSYLTIYFASLCCISAQ